VASEGGVTPWGEMMRAAAGFGVGPEGFWRLSLKEWRMLTQAVGSGVGAPMGRLDFEGLAARWPDFQE